MAITGRTLTAVTRAARRSGKGTLAHVTNAADELARARSDYRKAVQEARDAGHSLADIGWAAGVSRQEIHRITTSRHPKEG